MRPASTAEAGDSEARTLESSPLEPPENIFHRIGWETERFVEALVQNISKLGGKNKEAGDSEQSDDGLLGPQLEEFITVSMSNNVHEHILSYLKVAKPLLLEYGRVVSRAEHGRSN